MNWFLRLFGKTLGLSCFTTVSFPMCCALIGYMFLLGGGTNSVGLTLIYLWTNRSSSSLLSSLSYASLLLLGGRHLLIGSVYFMKFFSYPTAPFPTFFLAAASHLFTPSQTYTTNYSLFSTHLLCIKNCSTVMTGVRLSILRATTKAHSTNF